jgi:hypothetical protein
MKRNAFFKAPPKKDTSGLVAFDAPEPRSQIDAALQGKNWVVLNLPLLRQSSVDATLCKYANSFKHALQTHGPNNPEQLHDLRPNTTPTARGSIFHGHMNDSNGRTYVLEWEIVDPKERIIALTQFGTHENFKFKQAPMSDEAKTNMLAKTENITAIKKSKSQKEDLLAKYGSWEAAEDTHQAPAQNIR